MTIKVVLPAVSILFLFLWSACEEPVPTALIAPPNDLPPNLQERFSDDIKGTWKVGANGKIIRDTLDLTSLYQDFEVSFSDTSYATSGKSDFWPGLKGPWHFLRPSRIDSLLVDSTKMAVSITSNHLLLNYNLEGVIDTIPDTTFMFNYFVDLHR